MTDNSIHDDPEAIERDIRRTQEDMSRTVDKIGNQLSAKNMFNALLDKADENGVDAHYLLDGARRNPMALGLIAAGAIWLVSDKDSKFPSMPQRSKKPQTGTRDEFDLHGSDVHHRDYVTHMSGIEMRDGEDQDAYLRRRDLHRANFLMCEREPNEDDHNFRQRLNQLTDKFREKRSAWSDSVSSTGTAARQRTSQLASSARDGARQASDKAQDMYSSNPLVGGILAAAVGAALGSAIPVGRQEQEKFGALGRQARDMASEQKDQLTEQAMEKKDQLLDKIDQKLQADQGQSSQQQQPAFETAGGTAEFSGGRSASEGPFIISERSL
ncbi:MAG: DUF3618 domain-containing protein [Sphingomicrobium sp.]